MYVCVSIFALMFCPVCRKRPRSNVKMGKHMQARQNMYYTCRKRQKKEIHIHISNGPNKMKINSVEMKKITSLMH